MYNIHIHWTNFCQPSVCVQQNIFEQTLIEVGSLNLYASFGISASKLVNYSRRSVSLWTFARSPNRRHFLSKTAICRCSSILKGSRCLRKLTNLDAKGANRSVKMWATFVYKSFYKNTLLFTNCGLAKVTYLCYAYLRCFILVCSVTKPHFQRIRIRWMTTVNQFQMFISLRSSNQSPS